MKRFRSALLVLILTALSIFPSFASGNSEGYIYMTTMDDWIFDGIELSNDTFVYDGEEKKPDVTIGMLKGGSLTNWLVAADYTLTYKDCVNAGQASVTATGNANRYYGGSITAYYTIEPADISQKSIHLVETEYEYDGSKKCPSVIAEGLIEGSDYEVLYSDNINAGKASVSISGIGNYKGTVSLPFTIQPIDISNYSVTLSEETCIYDGTEKRPIVALEDLTEGKDYEVNYRNNINEGTASITISGTNNYSGTINKTFTIRKRSVSEFDITLSQDRFEFDGEQKCPTVSVGDLKEGVDYEVTYSNNIKAGKATATISGKGNYSGSVIKYYYIWKDLYSLRVDDGSEQLYKEGEQVSIESKNDIVYRTFSKWKILSGDLSLSSADLKNNPLTFIMPASDIEIESVYTGSSLQEELADENERYDKILSKEVSLRNNIDYYSDLISQRMSYYGVSSLQSETYYEDKITSAKTSLTQKQNRLASLQSNTSGGNAVEIAKLQQEISDLNQEILEYTDLKQAAGWKKQVNSWQNELNKINLSEEASKHERNIASICEKHGVIDSSVPEIKYIRLDKDQYNYTGDNIYPTVTIIDSNGNTLDDNSYEIEYPDDCISSGNHIMILVLKGNYVGSREVSFTIVKHEYGDWIITMEPNCTEEGSRERICAECGRIETEIIPFKHVWNTDPTIDENPTCTNEGFESIHCSKCDAVKDGSSRTIQATGHSYGDWSIVKEPTEYEKGNQSRTCSVCGDVQTEELEVLSHTHKPELVNAVEATCTTAGYSGDKYCSDCGELLEKGSAIAALGHKKISVKAVAATCQATGMKAHYECENCGTFLDKKGKVMTAKAKKKLVIKKKKHNFKEKSGEYLKSAATCTKPALYYYTCKMCHSKGTKTYKSGKALGHSYEQSLTAATTTKDGSIGQKCTRCGKKGKTTKIYKASKVAFPKKFKGVAYVGNNGEKPKVEVKNSKKKTIPASYYELSYDNNYVTGTGTVTITFKGNYSGTKTLTYKITGIPQQ